MATYMVQVSYTTEALKILTAKPQDRTAVIGKMVRRLGGRLVGLWMAFGDYDAVTILEAPDNVSAAALALAVAAGGSCKTVKTTPLLSVRESMAAARKAKGADYKPVGAK